MTRNSIEENLDLWDRTYDWSGHGEEWSGQARACGVPYPEWKQALIEHLIDPYVGPGACVVEIAPGHGRWSEALAARCSRLVLVDLSPSCVDYCRQRFAAQPHVEVQVGDGRTLPAGLDGAVDMVWSFDAFVHMAPADIGAYLHEIARVLRPGGTAVLHHANRRHWTLPLAGLQRGHLLRRVYRYLSMGMQETQDGWRSAMSGRLLRCLARGAGLDVAAQFSRWGPALRYGVPRFRDQISILRKTDGLPPGVSIVDAAPIWR